MTKGTHTVGPWKARRIPGAGPTGAPDGRFWIDCDAWTRAGRSRGGTLAECYATGCGDGSPAANAALIAAAPDLLAELIEAERFMAGFEDDPLQDGINERLTRVRAAIAKAQGVPSC